LELQRGEFQQNRKKKLSDDERFFPQPAEEKKPEGVVFWKTW